MNQPRYTYVPWAGTDHIYSEMSPLLNSNFNHFNHDNMITSQHKCETCLDYTQAHFFLICVCGKCSCCNCSFQRNKCPCDTPFNCNTVIVISPHYFSISNHECKLEKNFTRLKFFDAENLRQITDHSRNREELLLLKRWLELLQTPSLDIETCKFLVLNIIQISDTLGEACSDVFTQTNLNFNNKYFIENLIKSGPHTKGVDHTLRVGRHSMFLRIFNKTVNSKKENRMSQALNRIAHYKVTFLLFLILCTQIQGISSQEDVINFHVTQHIDRVDEIYNIKLDKGRPSGYVKILGQRTFSWDLGRLFIPKIINGIGSSHKVTFCEQVVRRAMIEEIFNKVSTCQEFEKTLNSKNILYLSAPKSQLFYYGEEMTIDNAVMHRIKMYESLVGGPITHRKFLNGHKYLNTEMIEDINETLNLSRYAFEQKVRIFLFKEQTIPMTCRTSICSQIDQFTYAISYIELTKSKHSQKNSHKQFNGLFLFIILVVCIHLKMLE
jgi:hypothetical protein